MEVTLGSIQAIPEGEGRNFALADVEVAVFHARGGGVFATQATCPHRGGRLADGLIGDGTVICPLHSLKYDLSSGASMNSECPLKVYPVRLNQGGLIVIDVGE